MKKFDGHIWVAEQIAKQENDLKRKYGDALHTIPVEAWAKALGEWQGVRPPPRGRASGYRWYEVIHALLHAGGLLKTGSDAAGMKDVYAAWQDRRQQRRRSCRSVNSDT